MIGNFGKIKCYSELITITNFTERLRYLQIKQIPGHDTFADKRYLNQMLYHSAKWKEIKRQCILRDSDGDWPLDLAHPDFPIMDKIYVHHINPITVDDILRRDPKVFDLDNLICCSFSTHQDIHYLQHDAEAREYIGRFKNDTIPWR